MSVAASITAPWDRASVENGTRPDHRIQPVSDQFTFSLPGWHVWCGSILETPEGSFCLYFSCWPESEGHEGWVTHSQIWRAEGPCPWGPYSNPEVVFAGHAPRSWDADNFHNVTVKEFGGRYFMYYTGNFGNGEWWVHRNNQRIGVATADSPCGPWRRSSDPLLDVSSESWDSLCVANPSVTATIDGRYVMIYKGVTSGDLPYGSKVLHGMAYSDNPDGPFEKQAEPIFQIPGARFPFEDPHIWLSSGRYRCLMKDMTGLMGSYPRATLLFESPDGLDWSMDDYRLVATPHLEMGDGEIVKVDRLERPAYFLHHSKPCLSFAVKPEGEGTSFLVFAPGRVTARAQAAK